MNIEILKGIGLSNSEVSVYLSLLELGESTSGPIIEKTKLQSSVIHRAIKSLIERGFISYVKIGKDKHYQVTDPKNLVNYMELKKKNIEELLPELINKQKLGKEKNEVEMFIGKRAIFSLLDNLIIDSKDGEEFFSFSLIEAHDDKEIIRFYKHYNVLRRDKKLTVKVLVNNKVKSIYEKNYSKELLKKANVRYTHFNFPQGIIIFRNILIFLNWQDNPTAIKITNQIMVKQFHDFFLEFYNKEKNSY